MVICHNRESCVQPKVQLVWGYVSEAPGRQRRQSRSLCRGKARCTFGIVQLGSVGLRLPRQRRQCVRHRASCVLFHGHHFVLGLETGTAAEEDEKHLSHLLVKMPPTDTEGKSLDLQIQNPAESIICWNPIVGPVKFSLDRRHFETSWNKAGQTLSENRAC